ncbi:TPA: hypothetical protein SMI33_002729 [Serratia marcescens]|nr:hypothetical protein [Serratia marcescens]
MSSIRLTTALRDAIAANAIKKSGVVAAEAENEKAFSDLAEKVRVKVLGGKKKAAEADAKLAEAMKIEKELHEIGATSFCISRGLRKEIYPSFGGARTRLEYSAGDSVYRLTPCREICLLAADDPLTVEFHRLDDKKRALGQQREEVKVNVYAALNSVSTVKRLLEAWPESKELLPANLDAARAALPALRVGDLNKLIGLPTEEESEA